MLEQRRLLSSPIVTGPASHFYWNTSAQTMNYTFYAGIANQFNNTMAALGGGYPLTTFDLSNYKSY